MRFYNKDYRKPDQTPEARLTAALDTGDDHENKTFAADILAADPTIAADLNDAPRLRAALRSVQIEIESPMDDQWQQRALSYIRAALTEGSGE